MKAVIEYGENLLNGFFYLCDGQCERWFLMEWKLDFLDNFFEYYVGCSGEGLIYMGS